MCVLVFPPFVNCVFISFCLVMFYYLVPNELYDCSAFYRFESLIIRLKFTWKHLPRCYQPVLPAHTHPWGLIKWAVENAIVTSLVNLFSLHKNLWTWARKAVLSPFHRAPNFKKPVLQFLTYQSPDKLFRCQIFRSFCYVTSPVFMIFFLSLLIIMYFPSLPF